MAVVAVGRQANLQLAEQGAPVGKAGQVVVECDVLGPLLGVDPRLELDEHGGDGLQGADLLGRPGVQPEVEEAKHAPGAVGQEAAARRRRRPAAHPSPSRPARGSRRARPSASSRRGSGSRRSFVAANTGSASNGTSPRGSGSTISRGGHSASRMLRPRRWSLRRRNATSAPRNSASTRVVHVSTSWRVRDDADMSRSATWPTSSSSRRWSSRRSRESPASPCGSSRPPKAFVRARSRLDHARPCARHDERADDVAVLELDRLDQHAPRHARDDAGERADRRSAPSWPTTRLRMCDSACSRPGSGPRLRIEAGDCLVEAARRCRRSPLRRRPELSSR